MTTIVATNASVRKVRQSLRLFQPLSHFVVLRGVARPPQGSTVPPVVLDGHVDAAVDEESHRVVVVPKDQLVQEARRLMGVPGGIDVCAVLEEEVRHLELAVEDGPGERGVEDVLGGGRAPVKVIVRSTSLS